MHLEVLIQFAFLSSIIGFASGDGKCQLSNPNVIRLILSYSACKSVNIRRNTDVRAHMSS